MKVLRDKSGNQSIPDRIIWQISKIARLRFWFLASRFDAGRLSLLFLFAGSVCSVLTIGFAAHFISWNLLFPSLGPTIFLQFYSPGSSMSCPRNAVLGHLIGAAAGLVFYWLGTFLGITGGAMGLGNVLLGAAALGVGGTFMAFTGLLHPPAASTILIGAFGMAARPEDILTLMFSAMILSAEAWLVHKAAGIKFPAWAPFERDRGPKIETRLGRLSFGKTDESGSMQDIAARLASRQKLK